MGGISPEIEVVICELAGPVIERCRELLGTGPENTGIGGGFEDADVDGPENTGIGGGLGEGGVKATAGICAAGVNNGGLEDVELDAVAFCEGVALGVESELLAFSLSCKLFTLRFKESIFDVSFFFSLISLYALICQCIQKTIAHVVTYAMNRSSFSSISRHLALSHSSI